MRNLLAMLLVACSALCASAAEKPKAAPKPAKERAERPANPCAMYGAGFVQVGKSSTCVKMGGSLTVDVGGRVGR
jgi:hypothetical protein